MINKRICETGNCKCYEEVYSSDFNWWGCDLCSGWANKHRDIPYFCPMILEQTMTSQDNDS